MIQQKKNYNFFIKDPKKAVISLVLTLIFTVMVLVLAPMDEEYDPGAPGQTENVGVVVPEGPAATVITASAAREMMESGEAFFLLDVRTLAEFDRHHIPGAISMPHTEIFDRVPISIFDRDARILVYCQTGRRSAEAGRILLDLGYTNVYDFGGIADWPY